MRRNGSPQQLKGIVIPLKGEEIRGSAYVGPTASQLARVTQPKRRVLVVSKEDPSPKRCVLGFESEKKIKKLLADRARQRAQWQRDTRPVSPASQ